MFTKLFLDTKSICFAVEKFKFYVLIHHVSSKSEQAVGFFSKENLSWDENNLACILIFPPFQSQGLGQLLIEFSYQLSALDGKLGSPEKPLSEYGRKSYLLYWCTAIYRALPYFEKEKSGNVSINDISMATGIKQEDVVDALKSMDALQKRNIEDSDEKLHWVVSKTNIENWALKRKVKTRPLIDPNYILIS
ncbi:acyl-CoA N-acyltransferase [Myxozyma melibiosi]|uniref:histone acetyltransferase n=1 Tax=Myxozyma melibiosi TaxID=54550 RepID=A0ABR1FD50_9ASCO